MSTGENGTSPHGLLRRGQSHPPSVWTILLAGGKGRRLAPLVESLHSDSRPKQFATLIGRRSMLQHTCARALRFSPRGKILVVITEGQQRWAFAQLPEIPTRNFIIQPKDFDTGPAICFAAVRVLAKEPNASVVILPTDHFIHPEEVLGQHIKRILPTLDGITAMSAVLLGVRPKAPRTDLGWIQSGTALDGEIMPGLSQVRGFIEKPRAEIAQKLFNEGGLWNTLILAAKVRRLWHVLQKRVPETCAWIARCEDELLGNGRKDQLERFFSLLTPFNFSSQVLQREAHELLVIPVEGMNWNDWGTPESVEETLESMGWGHKLHRPAVAGVSDPPLPAHPSRALDEDEASSHAEDVSGHRRAHAARKSA